MKNANRKSAGTFVLVGAALCALLSPGAALALTNSWAINTGGDFHTPGNWDLGVPAYGDSAQFARGGGATYKDYTYALTFTNDVTTGFRAIRNNVIFDLGAYTFTVAGGLTPTTVQNDGSLILLSGTMIHSNVFAVGAFVDPGLSNSGFLLLTNGAHMITYNSATIGQSSAKGYALITGSNTLWTHAGAQYISVGMQSEFSYGSLILSNQGTLTFTATNQMYIGRGATGVVSIVDGGVLDLSKQGGAVGTYYLQIGSKSTYFGSGTLMVDGAASKLLTGDRRFFLGFDSGSYGHVVLSNGGKMTGYSPSASSVGHNGLGLLEVTSGSEMQVGMFYIGANATGAGTTVVTGAGTTLTTGVSNALNGINFVVGSSGQGWLTVADTGTVVLADNNFRAGNSLGATGTVLVTSGGQIVMGHPSTNTLSRFGESGTGTMRIENGGTVSLAGVTIGSAVTGVGTVTVTGAGSKLTTSAFDGYFTVGASGKGTLIVENSGAVEMTDRRIFAGKNAGSEGTIIVRSGGSILTDTNNTTMMSSSIGETGWGSLRIESNGTATLRAVQLGVYSGSTGQVTVTGANAVLNAYGLGTGNDLTIGRRGVGTMLVESGGVVNALNSYVGRDETYKDGRGTLTVSGAGSRYLASTLGIGGRSWGTEEIFGGTGTVNAVQGGRIETTASSRMIVYAGSELHVEDGVVVAGRDLHLLDGSTLSVTLNAPDNSIFGDAGDVHALITATYSLGTVRLQSNYFNVSLGLNYSGTPGDTYTILQYGSNLSATDRWFADELGNAYANESVISVGGEQFVLRYADLYNTITLEVIPEPGTLGLIGAGLGLAALLRRRRG